MPGDDFYHRFEDDIDLMVDLGIRNFRLSIAWPRIFPNGTGKLNDAGIGFYSRLIDALLQADIEPHVTLYHWDLPQVSGLFWRQPNVNLYHWDLLQVRAYFGKKFGRAPRHLVPVVPPLGPAAVGGSLFWQ
jgi:Glycosyl hydrolase family 1